jgi:hypothetical protein
MRLILTSAAILATTLAAACASDPGAPGGGGGRAPAGPQIFFSPFGEPFRAAPGEPYPVAAWFAGADTNGDGALMLDEFTADGMRYFAVLDRDRDGEISPGEVAIYEAQADQAFGGIAPVGGFGGGFGGGRPMGGRPAQLNMAEPQAGMPQQGGASGLDQGLGADRPRAARSAASTSRIAMAGLLGVPQPVKSADANFNQYITRQEWTAVAQRWFGLLDANHDGSLTLAELPHTALQRGEDGRTGRAPPRVRQ